MLAAISEHQTNAQIARSLHISVRTVETHVSALLRKFGVPDRRALAASANHTQARVSARPGRFVGVPVSRTTFVGRERDCETALSALNETRLLSLLGPGGVGKTRLAAVVAGAAAPSFPSGGAFVDLVPAREATLVPTIAGTLGVTERPPESLERAIIERLRLGPSLLVLDNCEHLTDEVSGLVERVLADCPEATVLATSRERLGVPGERTIQVLPLPIDSDAERLFRDRASAVDAGFTADPSVVTELCTRLDGMPLAIELAAARAASLGPDGLLTAIEDRLRLLAGGRGADRRHRSLKSMIGWSHDLLDSEERLLFRRLAVFVGGFDLDAAASTVPSHRRSVVADVIGRLVDKSLIVHLAGDSRSRWRMLETIRAFATDQLLATDEQEESRRLHLHWAASKAAEIEARITDDWRAELDDVIDDLRAALAATTAEPDRTAHQLARSLAHLTFARKFFLEAQGHYQAAAERAEDPTAAYQDLRSAADTALATTGGHPALQFLLDAAELARSAGDGNAQATALASAIIVTNRFPAGITPDVHARGNGWLREATEAAADVDEPRVAAVLAAARAWAMSRAQQAPDLGLSRVAVDAARGAGDPVLLVAALDPLITATATTGRLRDARRIASERLQLADALPRHEPSAAAEIVDAFHTASRCALVTGDLPAALGLARRAVTDDPIGDEYLAAPKLIRALALTGRFDEAIQHADEMWNAWRRAGSPSADWMSTAVSAAALVHGLRGHDHHDLWRSRALEIAGVDDATRSPALRGFAAFVDARVALHLGRLHEAATLVEYTWTSPDPWYQGYARSAAAELAVVADLPDATQRLTDCAPAAAENDWAAACLARATGRLNADADTITEAIARWERIDARFERACTLLLLPDRALEGHLELTALACPPPAGPRSR